MNQFLNHANSHSGRTPIVAIHGSASSGDLWRKLKAKYAADRLVLTPELSGYGKHDSRLQNLNSTLELRAKPLIESIRELDTQVDLVAHSFGASVAMQIVRTLPEHVRSMTFYEPVIPALLRDSGKTEEIELLGDLIALSEVVKGTTSKVAMETFINFWSYPGTWDAFLGQGTSEDEFRTPALYKYSRHPMYVGILIVLWATPTMTIGHLILACLWSVYVFIGTYFEERDLVRQFGSKYLDYQKNVSKLLPVKLLGKFSKPTVSADAKLK